MILGYIHESTNMLMDPWISPLIYKHIKISSDISIPCRGASRPTYLGGPGGQSPPGKIKVVIFICPPPFVPSAYAKCRQSAYPTTYPNANMRIAAPPLPAPLFGVLHPPPARPEHMSNTSGLHNLDWPKCRAEGRPKFARERA